MAVLTTQLVRDETFDRRCGAMEELVRELRERTVLVARGGGEKALERHRSRGQLTARERRDGEGRLLLPGDREEAPPRPGGRAAEPAPLRLPCRLRRGVPSAPGRGLPGSRPLRADLLQPSSYVRARRPADRSRHGLVH